MTFFPCEDLFPVSHPFLRSCCRYASCSGWRVRRPPQGRSHTVSNAPCRVSCGSGSPKSCSAKPRSEVVPRRSGVRCRLVAPEGVARASFSFLGEETAISGIVNYKFRREPALLGLAQSLEIVLEWLRQATLQAVSTVFAFASTSVTSVTLPRRLLLFASVTAWSIRSS